MVPAMIADISPMKWDRRAVKRPAPARRQGRNNWHALAERRRLAGLTTRGTLPKRRLEGRMVLADIDALAAAIGASFHDLTPAAQARALQLEIRLAAVRQTLV
jgi:hypothetical protein